MILGSLSSHFKDISVTAGGKHLYRSLLRQMGSQDQLKWLLLSVLYTKMKTLKIKRKQERLQKNQATHTKPVLSPQLSFEDLSNVGFRTYINKQVYSHTYVIDRRRLIFWSKYFSPGLSKVFLSTCFSSFSFSPCTFEPVGQCWLFCKGLELSEKKYMFFLGFCLVVFFVSLVGWLFKRNLFYFVTWEIDHVSASTESDNGKLLYLTWENPYEMRH